MSNKVQINSNWSNKFIISLLKSERIKLKEMRENKKQILENIKDFEEISQHMSQDPTHPFNDPYHSFHQDYSYLKTLLAQQKFEIKLCKTWLKTYYEDINRRTH